MILNVVIVVDTVGVDTLCRKVTLRAAGSGANKKTETNHLKALFIVVSDGF
jgi:hypothetical protein